MNEIIDALQSTDVKLLLVLVIKAMGLIISILLTLLCYFIKGLMRDMRNNTETIASFSSLVPSVKKLDQSMEKLDARLHEVEIEVAVLVGANSKKRRHNKDEDFS